MDVNGLTEKLIDFYLKYSGKKDTRENVKEVILLHFKYLTGLIGVDDKGEITWLCRWDVRGSKADVLGFYVREDYRNKHLIEEVIKKGLNIFPQVQYIGWQRGKRPNDRGYRYYPVDKLLKRRSNGR